MKRAWAGFGIAMALAGCGRMTAPVPRETADVRGRLLAGGTPIGRGWVQFWPVEGTVGNMRAAPLEADGSFRMTRAPVGRVVVLVTPAAPIDGGDRYRAARIARAQGFDSPIRLTIGNPPADPLNIDLLAAGP
ncbi:MAG: hypothetical protein U0800_07120 [Isosphaeraceae bacterium]